MMFNRSFWVALLIGAVTWIAIYFLVVATGYAETRITKQKNSIGETHIRIQQDGGKTVTGTSRRNSIGETNTNYSNGVRCSGRTNSIGVYTETCR